MPIKNFQKPLDSARAALALVDAAADAVIADAGLLAGYAPDSTTADAYDRAYVALADAADALVTLVNTTITTTQENN